MDSRPVGSARQQHSNSRNRHRRSGIQEIRTASDVFASAAIQKADQQARRSDRAQKPRRLGSGFRRAPYEPAGSVFDDPAPRGGCRDQDADRLHTFRATGITAYLKNGGKLEVAQQMAAHESARTTGLYDRRGDEISLDEVERIAI
jgi:hypothetical protein